jgi:protein tyrosine/serine phosphatase
MKKFLSVFFALSLLLALASCSNSHENEISTTESSTAITEKKPKLTASVTENKKFDSVYLNLTSSDFEDAGFSLGDSCDVVFSNGYSLTDIPYYNGYYVKKGENLIVAYPSEKYVIIAANNSPLWSKIGLNDGDTVEITLNTAGKYIATSDALGQSYSIYREDYDSDSEFANFRSLSGGNLKENFLYRGASPFDNSRNRPYYVDLLLKESNIKLIIDLADSDEDVQEDMNEDDFNSPYSKELYDSKKVALLDMGSDYDSTDYKTSVANGMKTLIENDGPAYIHCTEGKDRTGFVCIIIEALAGASYDEMRLDYMTTYENYYGITETTTPEKYGAVLDLYFNTYMEYFAGTDDIDTLQSYDYTSAAEKYLLSGGMTTLEIGQLKETICE